jgi:hypothetical protein
VRIGGVRKEWDWDYLFALKYMNLGNKFGVELKAEGRRMGVKIFGL